MGRDALQRRFARIALAYFAFLVLLLGSVAFLAAAAQRATEEARALAPAQLASRSLAAAMADQETGQRGYVITRDESFLSPFVEGESNAASALRRLGELLDDDEARSRIDLVETGVDRWQDAATQEIDVARRDGSAAATVLVAGGVTKTLFDDLRASIVSLDELVDVRVQDQRERVGRAGDLLLVTLAVGSLLAVALAVLSAQSFRRWNRVRTETQRERDGLAAGELEWNRGLVRLSTDLSAGANDLDGLGDIVAEHLRVLLGANYVNVGLSNRHGKVDILIDRSIRDLQGIDGFEHMDQNGAAPIAQAIREGQTVIIPDKADFARRFPALAAVVADAGVEALVVVPLLDAAHIVIGALGITMAQPISSAVDSTVSRLASAADVVAQNVVRIRWTQGAETLALMARHLGDAADEDAVAGTVARYTAETVDGMSSSVVVANGRPPWRLHSCSDTEVSVVAVGPDDGLPVTDAVSSAGEILLEGPRALRARYPHLVEGAGEVRSIASISLPVLIDDRAVAGLSVGWAHAIRPSLALRARIETIVELIVQALERIELARAEHELTRRLGDRLAADLPALDRLELAVRYRPAMSALGLGGDWYQVVEQPDGTVVVVVGDVIGHGVDAAADMAQLRTTIGTLLRMGISVDELFSRLESLIEGLEMPTWGSALAGAIDRERGTLRVAVAGHLPPIVWRPDAGCSTTVPFARHPLLGIPTEVKPVQEMTFPPGCVLVAYTDGLVERRDVDITDGIAELTALFERDAATDSCEELADRLLAYADDSDHNDDIALVVVRHLP